MINLKINGTPVTVSEGTTILEAARKVNVAIPTLCHHPDLPAWAACGICIVKQENSPKMLRACTAAVADNMSIITHDPEIVATRRTVIELILSAHPNTCLQCPRNQACELQTLAADFGIREMPFEYNVEPLPQDVSTTSLILNPEKCVKCGRCVNVCQSMQNVWALEFVGRGDLTRIAPAGDVTLAESPCIKCGQCSAHCPVGAIYEKDETGKVWEALRNPDIHCVVQIAPAVRVALGEAFGLEPGELVTNKAYTALRRLGFDAIFDTNFGADLTIMEEGSELIERLKNDKAE
ncbi:MAG: 2Fe-2S iron-sulfur cluster-binding protein, partial [Spirochaetaceae bacterium]|nr:2Fe-2S iron-sulfur cluster-binding protein [Spirochaetaceae bacterium]